MKSRIVSFLSASILLIATGSARATLITFNKFSITPSAMTLNTNTTDTGDANSVPNNPPRMTDTSPDTKKDIDFGIRSLQVDSKVVVNPDTLLDGNVYAGFRWQFSATGSVNRLPQEPSQGLTYWDMATIGWVIQYAGFGGLGSTLSVPYTGLTFTFDGTGAGELSFSGAWNILGNSLTIPVSGIALNFDSFSPLGQKLPGDFLRVSNSLILDYPLGDTLFTLDGELLYQVTGKASAVLPTIMQVVPEFQDGISGGYLRTRLFINQVPEPSPFSLMILGILGVLRVRLLSEQRQSKHSS